MVRRTTFFLYGAASYLIFFGTFLYMVGFVGNLGVPRTLDGPATAPLGSALVIDLGLIALFAVQHSVMARPAFKERWTRIVPRELERSTFVLFASLALLLMFAQWRPLGGTVWSLENAAARAVLYALFAFGWGLVLAVSFLINHFDLFGLRQAWLALRGKPYTPLTFVTPGPYRVVRHPLYVGLLFGFWMAPTMSLSHLLFAAATTAYILVGIQLEERDLVAAHGGAYERYRRRVPMLWPLRVKPAASSEEGRESGDSLAMP